MFITLLWMSITFKNMVTHIKVDLVIVGMMIVNHVIIPIHLGGVLILLILVTMLLYLLNLEY